MYTKEQLKLAKEILLNLISSDRELENDIFGICFNMADHKLNKKYRMKYKIFPIENKAHLTEGQCISFVASLSVGWVHHTGDHCFMVPDNKSIGTWEGPNLELRIDLMKHIISKIDEMLEGL